MESKLGEGAKNSLLGVREVNLKKPLNSLDWKHWYTAISEVSGIGFVQFLPVGYKSDFPLVANTMNVLCDGSPSLKHLMLANPLDQMIQNRSTWLADAYQKLVDNAPGADQAVEEDPDYAMKAEYHKNSCFALEEFEFPHVVHALGDAVDEKALAEGYKKCFDFLQLENHLDCGLTILLSKKWIFVTLLIRPYTVLQGKEIFVDALGYAGIMNVQGSEKEWPQTAGIDEKIMTPIEILKKSSTPDPVPVAPEEPKQEGSEEEEEAPNEEPAEEEKKEA